MNPNAIITTACLLLATIAGSAHAQDAEAADDAPVRGEFVAIEIAARALANLAGTVHAKFGDAEGTEPFRAIQGGSIETGVSLRVPNASAPWSVEVTDARGALLLAADGTLDATGLHVGATRVDEARLALEEEPAPVRVVTGYASATIRFVSVLTPGSLVTRAELNLDATADAQAVLHSARAAAGRVEFDVHLPRAAPVVRFALNLLGEDGARYGTSEGLFAFARANSREARDAYEAEHVVSIDGTVDLTPHLVAYNVTRDMFVKTVAGAVVRGDGPAIAFGIGDPLAAARLANASAAPRTSADAPETGESPPTEAVEEGARSLPDRFPVAEVAGIVVAALVVAILVIVARRLKAPA